MRYVDRRDAGRALAAALEPYRDRHPLVLGLPRGGVPVAAEVASALGASLDVVVVRKLGFPGHTELAAGAVGHGGVVVLNEEIASRADPAALQRVRDRELAEVERRERDYRGNRPPLDVREHTAILVDDGIATGATMRAAVEVVRVLAPTAVVVAVPVAAPSAVRSLAAVADDVVCPLQPPYFAAVGEFYDDFTQTTDEEVRAALSGPN